MGKKHYKEGKDRDVSGKEEIQLKKKKKKENEREKKGRSDERKRRKQTNRMVKKMPFVILK